MKYIMNPQKTIYVDVDGTMHKNKVLNTKLIAKLESFKSQGADLILWSARGENYAKSFAEKTGVQYLFKHVIGKPTHIFDDMGCGWSKYVKVNGGKCK